MFNLSRREAEIVKLTAENLSEKEIAHRLGIATSTVKNLKTILASRTGLRGVVNLTRYAIANGLVDAASEQGVLCK